MAAPAAPGQRSQPAASPSRSRRARSCSAAEPTGAAVVGWPLLWAIPLFPFASSACSTTTSPSRSGSRSRSPRTRSRSSRPPSSACARAAAARSASAAAALFAVWPLLTRPLAGPSAWENGHWNVDVGLAPLHGAALDGARRGRDRAPARTAARRSSGSRRPALCSASRPSSGSSNGLFAAAAVGLARVRLGPRRTAAVRAGRARVRAARRRLLAEGLSDDRERARLLARAGVDRSWDRLADLRPADAARSRSRSPCSGSLASARVERRLLGAVIATNVALYTFYEHTHLHPRFLFVALPALFVLEAAGAWLVIRKVSRGRPEPRAMIARDANLGRHRRRRLPRLPPLRCLLATGHRVICVDNLETGSLAEHRAHPRRRVRRSSTTT